MESSERVDDRVQENNLSKSTIWEDSKQTIDAYTNGWQTRVMKLGNLVSTSLVAPSSLAESASDAPPTSESKCSSGE